MTESSIRAVIPCNIKKVWGTVTSLTEYAWRSDIAELKILGCDKFAEYTRDGYETIFTVTASDTYKRWEFDMDNSNMKGHWTGIFSEDGGKTVLDFTEAVEAKKFIMRPFVKTYLRKQQSQYIKDLQKACLQEGE